MKYRLLLLALVGMFIAALNNADEYVSYTDTIKAEVPSQITNPENYLGQCTRVNPISSHSGQPCVKKNITRTSYFITVQQGYTSQKEYRIQIATPYPSNIYQCNSNYINFRKLII